MANWNLIRLYGVPILEQLRLEEGLLRAGQGNWIVVNHGVPPAIVMGISGKPEQLLRLSSVNIPVIRRFSGGGTVVVDPDTVFVSLIGDHEVLPCSPFPCKIMRWTKSLYAPLFEGLPFSLRENDYVLGERKCGGNAQSLVRKRWLHHTTWLWSYDSQRMDMLRMPERQPEYRAQRAHTDFLCTLNKYYSSTGAFLDGFVKRMASEHSILSVSYDEAAQVMQQEYRRATKLVDIEEEKICREGPSCRVSTQAITGGSTS